MCIDNLDLDFILYYIIKYIFFRISYNLILNLPYLAVSLFFKENITDNEKIHINTIEMLVYGI